MSMLKANEVDSRLKSKNIPDNICTFLVYGKDVGMIGIRVKSIIDILKSFNDNTTVTKITLDEISQDPHLLLDSLYTIPMFGDKQIIHVRAYGSDIRKFNKTLKVWLAEGNSSIAHLVIEARDIAKTTELHKLITKDDQSMGFPCYADTVQSLGYFINDYLKSHNFNIQNEARIKILEFLGSDRQMTINELEKLITYMGEGRNTITLEDVLACVMPSSNMGQQDIINATLMGNYQTLEKALNKYYKENTSDVSIPLMRMFFSSLERLYTAVIQLKSGSNVRSVSMRNGLFNMDSIIIQWSKRPEYILKTIAKIVECEQDCMKIQLKINHQIVHRHLIGIAKLAKNLQRI